MPRTKMLIHLFPANLHHSSAYFLLLLAQQVINKSICARKVIIIRHARLIIVAIALEVRLVAAEQLGNFRDPIGEPKVLEVFEKKLTNGLDLQAVERTNVLIALTIGNIRTPALKKFLPKMLQNESIFVRIAAAKAVFQCLK